MFKHLISVLAALPPLWMPSKHAVQTHVVCAGTSSCHFHDPACSHPHWLRPRRHAEEQKIVARTRKTRKFFVFLREHRHELLDAAFQKTLAQS